MIKIGNLEVYGIIYRIINKINGKVYIGQTINKNGLRGRYPISKKKPLIEGVYRHHKYLLNYGSNGCNKHLLNAISKYGFNSFEVNDLFDVAFSKKELDIKEKIYINLYNSTNPDCGYNRREGASTGKQSKESIKLLKDTQIKNGRTRYVKQMTVPDLNVVKVFRSIAEATLELGLSRSAIKNVLNQDYQANTAGGYAWEYKDEKNKKYNVEEWYLRPHERSINKNNKYKQKCVDKINFSQSKEQAETQTEMVVKYFFIGKTIDEISKITGIKRKRVYQILNIKNLIPIRKQKDINLEASKTRGKVIELYLKGLRKFQIQKDLGLSKSIVEKAIEKYQKNIVDISGKYINKIN